MPSALLTMEKNLPRGIRNNNPLNLRHSADHWKGLSALQSDADFCQFEDIIMGIRAAMVCLRTHLAKDRKARVRTTVAREISRWAPSCENNVDAYLKSVCIYPHVQPESVIDFANKNQICCLMYRMAIHENGREVPFNYFEKAYEMV